MNGTPAKHKSLQTLASFRVKFHLTLYQGAGTDSQNNSTRTDSCILRRFRNFDCELFSTVLQTPVAGTAMWGTHSLFAYIIIPISSPLKKLVCQNPCFRNSACTCMAEWVLGNMWLLNTDIGSSSRLLTSAGH